MYVDLGKHRGRVHFTWKEAVFLWSLFATGVGYVIRSEVALSHVRDQLAACQQSVKLLQDRQAHIYSLPVKGGQ